MSELGTPFVHILKVYQHKKKLLFLILIFSRDSLNAKSIKEEEENDVYIRNDTIDLVTKYRQRFINTLIQNNR